MAFEGNPLGDHVATAPQRPVYRKVFVIKAEDAILVLGRANFVFEKCLRDEEGGIDLARVANQPLLGRMRDLLPWAVDTGLENIFWFQVRLFLVRTGHGSSNLC